MLAAFPEAIPPSFICPPNYTPLKSRKTKYSQPSPLSLQSLSQPYFLNVSHFFLFDSFALFVCLTRLQQAGNTLWSRSGVVFFLFVKYLLSRLLCVSFYSKAQMAKGSGSWSACGPVLAGDDMNTVPAVLAKGGPERHPAFICLPHTPQTLA